MATSSLFRGSSDPASLPSHLLTLSTLRMLTIAPGQAFTHLRATPIRILSHILGNYLGLLAHAAKGRAEQTGRTDVTFADAVAALAEYGMPPHVILDYVDHVRGAAPKSGAERERERAMHSTGQLLQHVVTAPRRGKRLTYSLFSKDELAALEKGSESEADEEPEDDGRAITSSPSGSSGDSSDSSEQVSSRMKVDRRRSPVRRLKRKATEMEIEPVDPAEAEALARWRSPEAVPDHIYPFLPPLPGLAKGDRRPEADDVKAEGDDGTQRPLRAVAARQTTHLQSSGEMWRSTVPYERSKLASITTADAVPTISASPEIDVIETGSLVAFHRLQEHLSDQPPIGQTLRPTEKRRRVAALLMSHRLESHDTLSASTPPSPYRQSNRSPGWVPYAYDQLGRQSVYLRDFDGPLIDSVSTSVLAQPAALASPSGRAPSLLSHLARQLSLQLPNVASRLFRLAPPGPIDENGTTIPYLLDEVGAQLAVAQPPHQNPLYFVPGWFWRTRDPTDSSLPKPAKAVVPAIAGDIPDSAMILESSPPPETSFLSNGDSMPFDFGEHIPVPEMPMDQPSELLPAQPIVEEADRDRFAERSRVQTGDNDFLVPSIDGSIPPPQETAPAMEREGSDQSFKVRFRRSETPLQAPRPDVPAINTHVAPPSMSPPVSSISASPSTGGGVLKLSLKLGKRTATPLNPTPSPAAAANLRLSPDVRAKSTTPLGQIPLEVSPEPFVPMPPRKEPATPTPPPAIMSPLRLSLAAPMPPPRTNGTTADAAPKTDADSPPPLL